MRTYFLQRLLHAIPLLFVLSIVLFLVVRSAPGGPLAQAERNPNITAEQREQLRARLGLDQPLHVQYITWISSVAQGDLGRSIKTNRPVAEMIGERVPNTLLLVGAAFILTVLIAIPLGALSALRQYSWFDYLVTTLSFAGQSVPVYWLGLVAILIFYVWLDNPFTGGPLLPAGGMYTLGAPKTLADLIWHMILPVAVLCSAWVAWYSRFFRASMLETLNADYVRTAIAKGLPRRSVVYSHAGRNAIIPLITMIALDLPSVFAGALFIETIFSWPGMGRLFWEAARGRDYPVLMAIIMINAVLIILANLIADMLMPVIRCYEGADVDAFAPSARKMTEAAPLRVLIWRRFLRHRLAVVAIVVLGLVITCQRVLAPLSRYETTLYPHQSRRQCRQFGTDDPRANRSRARSTAGASRSRSG